MVNWQITATTVRCDVVGEDVTLIVYKDWSVKCTGFTKYGKASDSVNNRNRPNNMCEGTDCRLAQQYRQKLQAEETETAKS